MKINSLQERTNVLALQEVILKKRLAVWQTASLFSNSQNGSDFVFTKTDLKQ